MSTIYVDRDHPAASDENPGTEDKPLVTLQAAFALAAAGTHIQIGGMWGAKDLATLERWNES